MIVSFSYFYGEHKTATSVVYDSRNCYFPSGRRKCYLVLNPDRNIKEWVKADACIVM